MLTRMKFPRILTVAAAAALLLTGCAAGGSSEADMAPAAGGAAYDGAEGGAADPALAGKEEAASADLSSDYLVREAWLGLKVDSVSEAAATVRIIATDAGGTVLREEFGDGGYGPATGGIDRFGTMTVSVPSDKLEATLTQLSELGEVRTRSSNAINVQDEYIDVEARIATLTASIARMRDLMAQTSDIDQIVKLETALSQRQADLDSLQARLNALKASIAMSPVTVTLTTSDDLGAPSSSVVSAFKDGWNDFKNSAIVLVRVLAALLPWLVVGGLVVWAAIWANRRWSGRHPRPVTAPAARPATAPAPTTPTAPPAAPPAPPQDGPKG